MLQKLIRYFKQEAPPKPEEKIKANQIQLNATDYVNPSVRYMIKRVYSQQVIAFSLENMMKRDFVVNNANILLGGFVYIGQDADWYAGGILISPEHMRWYGRYKDSNQIMFDLNIDGAWYQLCLMLEDNKSIVLEKVLSRVPEKLRQSKYYNRPNIRTYTATNSYITTRTLQGLYETFEKVELHITPLWMIVLYEERVIHEHFMDDIKNIQCIKHPTDKDSYLLTFAINDKTYIYTVFNERFAQRLSDAAREGIDLIGNNKKKAFE